MRINNRARLYCIADPCSLPLGQKKTKKKKGIAQLRARYTNQTILRRNDNLPSPGLEPGSPGRTRTILEKNVQIMSIYRGDFPSCDSGGGAGPSARTEAPPGAPHAPPLPIRWTFALGHLARPGFPPSFRPSLPKLERARSPVGPDDHIGLRGHAKRQNTPRYRVAECGRRRRRKEKE